MCRFVGRRPGSALVCCSCSKRVIRAHLLRSSAGYPIISHFLKSTQSLAGGFNLGGINASGQVRSVLTYTCIRRVYPALFSYRQWQVSLV